MLWLMSALFSLFTPEYQMNTMANYDEAYRITTHDDD